MEQTLKNSVIYKGWERLCCCFVSSRTYKVMCILLNWCRNSAINGFFIRYLARNSSLKYSLTYRFLSKVFSLFDRLWDKLYNFALSCGKSSSILSLIRAAFCNNKSFEAYGIVALFFSLGFSTTCLLLGTFDILKSAIAGMGIIVSLLLFIGKNRWTAYLKGSWFWRFMIYFFD